VQFPVSFKNTNENRDYLDMLLQRFAEYPRVVEVRHASWGNANILRHFAEKGIAFCNIDQPVLGRSLGPSAHATSGIGYVRLHGRRYDQWFTAEKGADRYDYLYAQSELAEWKSRIDRVAEKTVKTFVVANNHFEGKAVANGLQLRSMIEERPVPIPETMKRAYPELAAIAAPPAQAELL